MIEFNGKQYSGSIVKDDSEELIVSISSNEMLPDICLAVDNVKTVVETTVGGSTAHNVNKATYIGSTIKGVYTITFTKKLTVMEEMNKAIDDLLVMVLEGDNNV